MSPYQHLFSTNAVLNVWRNLRNNRDQNDLLLAFQYHTDDVRHGASGSGRFGKGSAIETSSDEAAGGRKGLAEGKGTGKSIGFVVPWRSMQAQKRELREKERELAEALVVLAGEVSFADLPPNLQSSLTQNPRVQIRHLAAGLSRQMSKIELQMADNAPFSTGKNLYTGGEIARKFLPDIQTLFQQRPVPQRMIFELLMELKDLIFLGCTGCEKEVLEWEAENWNTIEEFDEAMLRAITPISSNNATSASKKSINAAATEEDQQAHSQSTARRLLTRKTSISLLKPQSPPQSFLLATPEETLYHLESLETTASALSHLPIPIPDFAAHSIITIRRLLPRQTVSTFPTEKKKRTGRCAEYARCMKWGGTHWRQGGGCRRGCKNEDEDPEGLPSWHSSSRWFDERGTYMVGGGRAGEIEEEGEKVVEGLVLK